MSKQQDQDICADFIGPCQSCLDRAKQRCRPVRPLSQRSCALSSPAWQRDDAPPLPPGATPPARARKRALCRARGGARGGSADPFLSASSGTSRHANARERRLGRAAERCIDAKGRGARCLPDVVGPGLLGRAARGPPARPTSAFAKEEAVLASPFRVRLPFLRHLVTEPERAGRPASSRLDSLALQSHASRRSPPPAAAPAFLPAR